MAADHVLNFAALATGTELETPTGIGRFRSYKKGNFRGQNVLVEFIRGKTKWYPEEVLKLAPEGRRQVPKLTSTSLARIHRMETIYYTL